MYDDLILRLRDTAKMSDALHVLLPHSEGNATAKLYREAADAIEKLSKPRWIPVTERLPDFEGCVLCMRKAFVGDKLRYQDILYYEEGTFYMEFEDTPIPTEVITHWMPLPPAPKEE